jgi:hypothetical protein
LLMLFIFRLVFSKNQQGYATTIGGVSPNRRKFRRPQI